MMGCELNCHVKINLQFLFYFFKISNFRQMSIQILFTHLVFKKLRKTRHFPDHSQNRRLVMAVPSVYFDR